jgi:hypothetical protein
MNIPTRILRTGWSPIRALARRWNRFWFTPADPTALGVVRFTTGLVVLYVLLMTGPNLQDWYGKEAWVTVDTENTIRRETPWTPPSTGWGEPASFKLTEQSLTALRAAGVPQAVLAKLQDLQGKEFETQESFLQDLTPILDQYDRERFEQREAQDRGGAAPPAPDKNERERIQGLVLEHAVFWARPDAPLGPRAHEYRARWGIDPRQTIDQGQPQFSLWFHLTDPGWMAVFHWLGVAAALLLTVGLWTRVTSVLTWLAVLGYIHRSPQMTFGQDTMLALLLLYLMIGPSGGALSVDRLIARYRAARGALERRRPVPTDLGPARSVSANVVLRLLQIHFCVIYLASGTSKMQGAAWWNGTAIWQTWTNYEFAPPRLALWTSFMHFLTDYRPLWEVVLTGQSAFTLVLEVSLPFLIWYPRWRWLCLIGATLLHTGIALTMGLVAFSLAMLCIVVAFIPARTIRSVLARLFESRARLWLVFSSRQPPQRRTAALVAAADVWGQVALVDATAKEQAGEPEVPGGVPPAAAVHAPQLVTEQGQVLTGPALFERLTRTLRLLAPLWPLAWLRRREGGEARRLEAAARG